MELSWWQSENRETPIVCRRSLRLVDSKYGQELCRYIRIHAYLATPEHLKEMSGSPLIHIQDGNRLNVLLCEMEINKTPIDPIAGKLFTNLIQMMYKN